MSDARPRHGTVSPTHSRRSPAGLLAAAAALLAAGIVAGFVARLLWPHPRPGSVTPERTSG